MAKFLISPSDNTSYKPVGVFIIPDLNINALIQSRDDMFVKATRC
jgi:hypothetical protein